MAELLLQRGFELNHETVRAWEFRFAPLLADQLRRKRRGRARVSWFLDETYVKVAGCWCYLYRAIDRDGELLESMLSEHRDKHAAHRGDSAGTSATLTNGLRRDIRDVNRLPGLGTAQQRLQHGHGGQIVTPAAGRLFAQPEGVPEEDGEGLL